MLVGVGGWVVVWVIWKKARRTLPPVQPRSAATITYTHTRTPTAQTYLEGRLPHAREHPRDEEELVLADAPGQPTHERGTHPDGEPAADHAERVAVVDGVPEGERGEGEADDEGGLQEAQEEVGGVGAERLGVGVG